MNSRFSQSARMCTIAMVATQFVEYASAEKPSDFYPEPIETIPDGRSPTNSAGYRQDLIYSTILNSKGKQYFDMSLTLEAPEVIEDYVM